MNIQPWDPHAASDDELQEHYAFFAAIEHECDPETPPQPFELWRRGLLQTSPFFESKRWEASDDTGLVATGWLGLNRTDSNTHLASFDINVRFDARRRGIGRAVLAAILDAAAADGRTTLSCGAPKDSPGEAFLGAMGMDHKLLDRRSRLRVNDVDQTLVDSWIADAKAKASDYSLMLFDGPIEDRWVQPLIELEEAMNDAPRDDLDMEDWHQTPEQFQDDIRRSKERGVEFLYLVAKHDATDQLAAFTYMSWHPQLPQLVWQGGTAVRREHRGHALGRWIKATNYNTLRERNSSVEFVDTWNAGSNKWMLAINDDMGFRPYLWYTARDAKIADIKKALA